MIGTAIVTIGSAIAAIGIAVVVEYNTLPAFDCEVATTSGTPQMCISVTELLILLIRVFFINGIIDCTTNIC